LLPNGFVDVHKSYCALLSNHCFTDELATSSGIAENTVALHDHQIAGYVQHNRRDAALCSKDAKMQH
jgi:hypothetical protein